jgi:NAD(P)H-hydrate epimerase
MTNAYPLFTAAQVRELDRLAIVDAGIPGYTLMTRAGEALWHCLCAEWPAARGVLVVCGTGNNGGDGYVVARLALEAQYRVRVVQLGDAGSIRGDALTARKAYLAAGGACDAYDDQALEGAEVIVDALLGTGLERPLEQQWLAVVDAINATGVPVLAVDIPSGLHADTGCVLGAAVRARHTVTFIGRKQGLVTGAAGEFTGTIHFDDLQVPGVVRERIRADARLLTSAPLGRLATPRARDAHKGDHGHVLVVGGDCGMIGAVRLAGEAALRTGAGLVSLATRPEHAAVLAAACPELMSHGVGTAPALRALLQRASVVAIGPGLGQSRWARELLSVVLETRLPLVVDADALNLLSREPVRRENWVLTPHPGEAARLLGHTTAAIQSDRFAAVRELAGNFGGVAVLKGVGSLVATGRAPVAVCGAGNPGMASGGMGDVLSGVIPALIAQGLDPVEAATAGVCIHALAADRAAADGERGLLARDVIAELRAVMQAGGECV